MPNPLVFPCSRRRTCPGVDLPIENYSAEAGEPGPPFWAVVYPTPPNQPPRTFYQAMGCLFMCTSWNSQAEVDACVAAQTPFCDTPPTGFYYAWGCKSICVSSISQDDADQCAAAQLSQCQNESVWQAEGCVSLCTSYVSQEDADLCALRQTAECTNGNDGGGSGGDSRPGIVCNTEQSCSYTLADGTVFTYTVPAGTFCADTLAKANAQALAYGCSKSSDPNTAVSLGDLITTCCKNNAFSKRISLSQNSQSGTWSLGGGSVPDGLTLQAGVGDSVLLDGTPTDVGDYSFTVRFTTPSGHTADRTYTLKVENCGSGGCGGPTAYGYYKCNETSGLIVLDEIASENMAVDTMIAPVAGIIGGAFHMTGLANYAQTALGSRYNMYGHDFSVRLWFKLDAAMAWPLFGVFLGYNNWALGYSISGPVSGITFRVKRDIGGFDKVYGGEVTVGGWHRVCAWWQSGVQIGIKVDNNASVIAVPTDIMDNTGDGNLYIASSSLGHSIDEIAIWRDKVLSETEMLCDWNSGIGKTYPNVP